MKSLFNKVTVDWLKAAAIRAIRTMAQTALALISVGAAINEINWMQVASVSFVAGFASVLTSLATKLPELPMDGVMSVDLTGNKDIYRLDFSKDPLAIADQKTIVLKVNTTSLPVSQEKPIV